MFGSGGADARIVVEETQQHAREARFFSDVKTISDVKKRAALFPPSSDKDTFQSDIDTTQMSFDITSLKLVCRLFATQSLTLSFSFNSRRQRATGDDFEAAWKALEDGRSGLVSIGASDEN